MKIDLQQHAFSEDKKFFEGNLEKKWKTDQGNYMIALNNVSLVRNRYGAKVLKPSKIPIMNFMIPRRRQRIMQECDDLVLGERILIMLIPESRSGKKLISEIEVVM